MVQTSLYPVDGKFSSYIPYNSTFWHMLHKQQHFDSGKVYSIIKHILQIRTTGPRGDKQSGHDLTARERQDHGLWPPAAANMSTPLQSGLAYTPPISLTSTCGALTMCQALCEALFRY